MWSQLTSSHVVPSDRHQILMHSIGHHLPVVNSSNLIATVLTQSWLCSCASDPSNQWFICPSLIVCSSGVREQWHNHFNTQLCTLLPRVGGSQHISWRWQQMSGEWGLNRQDLIVTEHNKGFTTIDIHWLCCGDRWNVLFARTLRVGLKGADRSRFLKLVN